VVVKPAYIAVHGQVRRCSLSSIPVTLQQRTAQVVGEVVNINETPDLHVGDVVYSPSAPLHSLFVADATVLHKIDTTLVLCVMHVNTHLTAVRRTYQKAISVC
jgi:hypothetical protein